MAVPDGMKTEIAQALHSGVGAGHWGPRRMLATARQYFWWRDMIRHLTEWCQSCVACQRTRAITDSDYLGDSEENGAPKPFEMWQIDTVVVEDTHFLSVLEMFSGLGVMVKLADQTSSAVVTALTVGPVQILGLPVRIQPDGGAEFMKHVQRGLRHAVLRL